MWPFLEFDAIFVVDICPNSIEILRKRIVSKSQKNVINIVSFQRGIFNALRHFASSTGNYISKFRVSVVVVFF